LNAALSMRTVHVVPGRQLTNDHRLVWSGLQASNPNLDSPFYTPDLTQVVARIRDDVEVAVMEEDGETVGFFPFQRSRDGRARPVVGRLTEFHGPITRTDLDWHPLDLIRRARLRAWYFDHLPEAQPGYVDHSWNYILSPFADVQDGFDAYEDTLRQRGGLVSQIRRKERKLAREVGPVRFEMHTTDREAFRSLLVWKAIQYERVGKIQVFNYPWTVQVLDSIRQYQSDRFAGVMSALYAGDQLAAVHLGIRNRHALHIWFPTYNRTLEQYSPGLILLLHLVAGAAGAGVRRVDFGPGEERYKQEFKSGDTRLLIGGVDLNPGRTALRRGWYSIKQWVHRSRYREYLEVPLNATRRYRQRLAFR
jgi:CelD/BcsL family acetyltransferase involved in cellulose biosynthesis